MKRPKTPALRPKLVARLQERLVAVVREVLGELAVEDLVAAADGGGPAVRRRVTGPRVAKARPRRPVSPRVVPAKAAKKVPAKDRAGTDKRSYRCSLCREEGHRRGTCAERPILVPTVAKPARRFLSTPATRPEVLEERAENAKRQNRCSKCFELGHKATTCGRLLAPPSESSLRQKAALAAKAEAPVPITVRPPHKNGGRAGSRKGKSAADPELQLVVRPVRQAGQRALPWPVRTREMLAFLGKPRSRRMVTMWGRQQGLSFLEIDDQFCWLDNEGWLDKRGDGTFVARSTQKPEVAIFVGPDGQEVARRVPRVERPELDSHPAALGRQGDGAA